MAEEKKRKRPGPKPRPGARTKVIGVRVTPVEHTDLERQAAGESLTSFIRGKLGLSKKPDRS